MRNERTVVVAIETFQINFSFSHLHPAEYPRGIKKKKKKRIAKRLLYFERRIERSEFCELVEVRLIDRGRGMRKWRSSEREEKWLSRMVMAIPITRQNFFEGEKKKKREKKKEGRTFDIIGIAKIRNSSRNLKNSSINQSDI